jgi:hypothetical protein
MAAASEVSLNSEMKLLASAGKALRIMIGMMIHTLVCHSVSPIASPASRWPRGNASSAPRNTSVR